MVTRDGWSTVGPTLPDDLYVDSLPLPYPIQERAYLYLAISTEDDQRARLLAWQGTDHERAVILFEGQRKNAEELLRSIGDAQAADTPPATAPSPAPDESEPPSIEPPGGHQVIADGGA